MAGKDLCDGRADLDAAAEPQLDRQVLEVNAGCYLPLVAYRVFPAEVGFD